MKEKKVVKSVITYIETHLQEDLSLEHIADALHYSKFYIARSFSEEKGVTIYKYIQARRLQIAAEKLIETQKSIIEIALEANYNSQQAFTLAFRQVYLCSPAMFRKTANNDTMKSMNMGGMMAA